MLVAPSTTWLLVRTSPVEVRTIPVPAAVPDALADWNTVLMSTTAGSTLAAMVEAWTPPPLSADAGCDTAAIGAVALSTVLLPALAVFDPSNRTLTRPMKATSVAPMASLRGPRLGWALAGGVTQCPPDSLEKRSESNIEINLTNAASEREPACCQERLSRCPRHLRASLARGPWDLGGCWEDAGSGYSGVGTGRGFRFAGLGIRPAPRSGGTCSVFTEICSARLGRSPTPTGPGVSAINRPSRPCDDTYSAPRKMFPITATGIASSEPRMPPSSAPIRSAPIAASG